MTIDEISNSGFKFELEDKECEFSMITYQYAVKTQNAMYLLNNNEIEKGNAIINEIALVRNKFISISKGMETQNYQLSNLTSLYQLCLDRIHQSLKCPMNYLQLHLL